MRIDVALVDTAIPVWAPSRRITSYNVCYTKLLRPTGHDLGIADGLIRVSVGIENTADLISDFEDALGE